MTTASSRPPHPRQPQQPQLPPRLLTSDRGRRDVVAQVVGPIVSSQALAWFLVVVGAMVAQAGRETPDVGQVVLAVGLLLLAAAADAVTTALGERSCGREGSWLRRTLLAHSFGLGPRAFTSAQTGATVSMLTDGVERVVSYRQRFIGSSIASLLGPLLVLGTVALAIDPLSALVLAVCVPFIPLTIGACQRAFRKVSSASRAARGRLAADFLSSIQGLPTLTLLGAAGRVGDRLAATGEANRRATMSLLARNQLILLVTDAAFALFMTSAAAGLAFWRLEQGAISTGQALSLVLLATLLCAPVDRVGGFFYIGMAGRAMQRQLLGLLARPVPAPEPAAIDPASPAVDVREVTVGYDPARPVLDQVSMQAERGSRTVVLGPSGSGKSTLISVLSGDVVPQGGQCTVGGVPLRPGTRGLLRGQSALMRQQTWLFCGSLAENLRIGNPSASTEELWRVLERVGLADWARRLPEGLETELGERGLAVSGGQAQRISLARAILSGRDLLLLDEPTSQVDLESERIIWATVDELAADHTIVMASHRLSAAQHADQVLRTADHRLVQDDSLTKDLHR